MRNDHCNGASSPRAAAGGGLCKAFKDMKSKVATHTSISLSFVELVATSPAVGLLPALAPSPRSPSALLHRHMPFGHSISSFAARKPSSSEQSACADTEISGAAETENLGTQCMCAVDTENSGAQSTLEEAQISLPFSSYDAPFGQHSSASALSSCVLLEVDTSSASMDPSPFSTCHVCGNSDMDPSSASTHTLLHHTDPSPAMTHPSSPPTCHACEIPFSSSYTCNLPCSSASTSTLASRHPSLSSVSCSSSSSLTCNLPCANPSMSCGLFCEHFSSMDELQHGHQSACSLLREHSPCSHSYAPSEELVSAAPLEELVSADMYISSVDDTLNTSPVVCKGATTIVRVTSQIPSTTARVLYFLITLIFAVSSMSKGMYRSCMLVSRRVRSAHRIWHYVVVMICAGSVETKGGEPVTAKDDGGGGERMGSKADATIRQQHGSHVLKASCMKHSKLLKSKLRSSFKSLSVQVPRKAFAPLHFNALPHSASFSTPASPSSSTDSQAVNNSTKARKTRMLKGPAFASKITRSFHQRQSLADSPSSPGSQSQNLPTSDMICLTSSSCEAKEDSAIRLVSTNMSERFVMTPIIAVLVALCALFYGRGFGFFMVTAWLVAVSGAKSVCSLWKKP